nr:serine/arginine-rich splicing factor 1A [Ciona intestinalis]|eukprot:XP_002124933.3 serine/arginine-rich splicing factor 1A [Ciona intestinalis]
MSGRSGSGSTDCRIYVGNLPPDIRDKELDDLFYKYGNIRNIDLKNHRGSPFAFIDYEDYRDADDAVRARNGYNFDGYKLKVERPRSSSGFQGRPSNYIRGRPGPPSKRTEYRVIVEGLPGSGSWQDLKDHMREAGDVCYADVYRDGSGVVEFVNKEDMKFALKHMDDTKFRSHEGETSYIRVKAENDRRRSTPRRSRSNSRGRRRSPTYSPRRSRSRSMSRSRSRS